MAIQIRNTQSVQRSGPTNASVRTQAPASAFGALEAQANAGLGDAFERATTAVADAYAVREETSNLRIAKDLEREYVDMQNLLMYGDGEGEIGYLSLKGQHAVDAASAASARLQAFQDETLSRYEDNTRVTELYTDATSSRIDGANISIMQYASGQRDVVTQASSDAYKSMMINEALVDPMNEDTMSAAVSAIAAENAELAITNGITDPLILAEATATEQSTFMLSLIETAANDDPDNALILLAENVEMMSAVDADKAEDSIAAAESAARTSDSAARKEAIAIQEASWDEGNTRMQRDVANGTFDEAYWKGQMNLNVVSPSDLQDTIDYIAKSEASNNSEDSARALADYTQRAQFGEDTSALRKEAAADPSLMGDDYRSFLLWSTDLDDGGGTFMTSDAAQQALKDVAEFISPDGVEQLVSRDDIIIMRKNNAQERLTQLIKEGMSPGSATAAVIKEFARDNPLATANSLMALPLPLGLNDPDFTAPVRPEQGQDTTVYRGQLDDLFNAASSEFTFFEEQVALGAYTAAEVDHIMGQFDAVKLWHEMAVSELAMSGMDVADTTVAE